MLVYRGYVGYANFDEVWYGCILDISDLVTYEAETKLSLEVAFKAAVDDYIKTKEELGWGR